MTKAYSYRRFSTPEQSTGDSFRRQRDAAARYAERHGLELDEELTFDDPGLSAYRGANATKGQLGVFLEAPRHGDIPHGSYLLVEHLDRISRQSPRKALRTLEDIVEAGITLVTLNDGREYTEHSLDTDLTSLFLSILEFAGSHQESLKKSQRLSEAWTEKRHARSSGDSPGRLTALCPRWLRPDNGGGFEVVEDRVKVIRSIFDDARRGVGKGTIAARLIETGVPVFGRGLQWRPSYVEKILKSPAVIGIAIPCRMDHSSGQTRRVPTGEVFRDYYPAVVDTETYEAVQVIRAKPSSERGRHSGAVLRNVLAGLGKCPVCMGTMTRVTKGSSKRAGRPYLVCSQAKDHAGCVYRAVRLDDIELALSDRADELVDTAPAGDRGGDIDANIEKIEAEIAGIEDVVEQLLRELEVGRGTAEIRSRLQRASGELEGLRGRRADLLVTAEATSTAVVKARLADLRDALKVEPLDIQRVNTLLKTVLDTVVVDYREGHLVFRWHQGGESGVVFGWPDGSV